MLTNAAIRLYEHYLRSRKEFQVFDPDAGEEESEKLVGPDTKGAEDKESIHTEGESAKSGLNQNGDEAEAKPIR